MHKTLRSALLPAVLILAVIAVAVGLADSTDQCVTPAAGPLGAAVAKQVGESFTAPYAPSEQIAMHSARPGEPAPDFEASGYYDGGFKNFKLSDFKGKWVTLCFYPGDFTFV